MTRQRRLVAMSALTGWAAAMLAIGGLWFYSGSYGLHVLFRHGGTWWIPVATGSRRLSPSMRLALGAAPPVKPGTLQWRSIDRGFEVADLPAMVDGHGVDHVLLARIDPARFRFVTRTAYEGDAGLDQWMAQLHPALVINGSYSGRDGRPATPIRSDGNSLGPQAYDAKAGAFISSPAFTGVIDLAGTDWRTAFNAADDAMVSFPLLLARGITRVEHPSRWLANRSFIGQDADGRIVVGTTTDAFFSLDRFARFLLDSSIGLVVALNLDGGPVASQGISLNGFERRTYGRWEAQAQGDQVSLLTWPYGTVAMPIVLAVFPKSTQ